MTIISAKDAYEKSVDIFEKHIDFIEEKIMSAALDGKTCVQIRNEPYCRWLYDNAPGQTATKVLNVLKDAGYSLRLYYKELQFVDMALEISWDLEVENEKNNT